MKRVILFAEESDGVQLAALYREEDGRVTLTVKQPGTVTLPTEAVKALGDAARFEALRHKDAAQVGD